MSLKKATSIIGIMDMESIIAALVEIGLIALLGFLIAGLNDVKTTDADARFLIMILVIVVILLIVWAVVFYLGLLLKKASDQKNLRKCRICYVAKCVFFALNILGSTILLLYSRNLRLSLAIIMGLLHQMWCLRIVFNFMNELKAAETSRTNDNGQVLTRA